MRWRAVDTPLIAYATLMISWGRLLPPEALAKADGPLRRGRQGFVGRVRRADRVPPVGQEYTALMLELLETYRRLNELGVKIGFAALGEKKQADNAERERLPRRAFELSERREQMLLAHRDWAVMDEGLYAFTVDRGLRPWHVSGKEALGIDRPSALTGERLRR